MRQNTCRKWKVTNLLQYFSCRSFFFCGVISTFRISHVYVYVCFSARLSIAFFMRYAPYLACCSHWGLFICCVHVHFFFGISFRCICCWWFLLFASFLILLITLLWITASKLTGNVQVWIALFLALSLSISFTYTQMCTRMLDILQENFTHCAVCELWSKRM